MAEKVALLQKMVEMFRKMNATGFGKMLSEVRVTGGGEGRCTCELMVKEEHRNRQGFLHGGMTATLVESASAAALSSLINENQHTSWLPGICLHLNISYLKAAAVGEEIIIEAKTVKLAPDAAVLNVDIMNKQKGTIIAHASQTRWQGSKV